MTRITPGILAGVSALGLMAGAASADQVILDDLIVDGSICAGQDCVNGESFGFDTLRLKENNLRIKAQDTSNSASFPTQDWQLTFNDSTNGGANKFSIDAISPSSSTPFTIEAGAPSNALYVDDGGRIGAGTATPVVELHVVNGDSPTLRLEQNGSSGFTPQTWDVAGNEAGFFVRDVTNGSQLAFRIIPGADAESLVIGANNNVGLSTSTSPSAPLHVRRTGASVDTTVLVDSTSGDAILQLKQAGTVAADWVIRNSAASGRLNIGISGGNTPLKIDETANDNLLKLGDNTNSDAVIVEGQIIVNNMTMTVPDYVFEDDYDLMPLSQVEAFIAANGHLPKVPSAAEITGGGGLNMVDMQLTLLEKVEELTLYTLAQEEMISALQARIDMLETAD